AGRTVTVPGGTRGVPARLRDRHVQIARTGGVLRHPAAIRLRQGVEKGTGRPPDGGSVMRRVDLPCYPGTREWNASQGLYVEALGQYWGNEWVGKSEDDVVADVSAA